MYHKNFKQLLRVMATSIIVAIGLSASPSYASYGTCSSFGVMEHECFCVGSEKRICSDGEVWDPGPYECTRFICPTPTPTPTPTPIPTPIPTPTPTPIPTPTPTPTPPPVSVPGKDKLDGPKEGTTPKVGDPISAGGGEFRDYWTLLSLGGLIPIDFTLGYMPDMADKTPTSDRRVQFPPSEAIKAFTSNTVMRLVEFTDKSVSPNVDYINILMFNDLLVFKYDSATAKFMPIGPVKYQLEKLDSNYFLMNPSNELVYHFGSRALTYDRTSPAQSVKRVGEVKYIFDRNDSMISYTYNSDYLPTMIEESGTGRKLNLTYSSGNLSSVSDSFGRSVSFVYQTLTCGGASATTLTGFTDAMGQQTTFEYDTSTNPCYLLKKINRPMGNSLIDQTWASNPKGVNGVNSQKDAYNNQTTLSWAQDASGNLITTVTNPDSTQQIFHHEAERYPLDLTDAANKIATIGYTADNQKSQITDRLGDTTSMTYHPLSGKFASVTNAEGKTFTYTYTAQTQTFVTMVNFTFYDLTRTDYPDGANEQSVYDAKGNVISRTDRSGKAWQYTYNAKGQVLTAMNPAGGVVTNTYNADGTLASAKDSETGTSAYAYDSYKRLIKITHPDGKFIQRVYNLNDQLISVTDENNQTYAYTYDANGNLIKVTDPSNNFMQYAHDNMDRVNKVTNKLGKFSSIAFDNMGRAESITDPGLLKTQYSYDSNGWLNKITQNGGMWQTGYDGEGVVSSSKTPLNQQTSYETDKLGYLRKITDPSGSSLTFTRDAMSRLTSITDGLNRKTTYSYSAEGSLSGVTLPDIGAVTYTRNNPLGLISQITDLNGSTWKFAYSNMGRAQSITDPLNNSWQYAYNSLGQMNQVIFPGASTQSITYDSAGNITTRAFSAGPTLQFGYDALNRLTSAANLTLTRDAEGQITGTSDGATSFGASYDDAGRLKTATYNNNLFLVTYSYNVSTGLLDSVTDNLTNSLISFTYDAERKLIGINRPNSANSIYDYDAAGHLVRIRDGSFIDAKYTLDAAWQVTQADMTVPLDSFDAMAAGTENFTYNVASQTSTAGYVYDVSGRMTAAPGQTFAWDGASRLTKIGNVDLTYNGMGDLITRNDGTNTTRYFYNHAVGLHPIMGEKNESGSPLARYYVWTPGGQLLYMIDAANGDKVYHYHFDRTGSTLALTDSTGAITDKYAYDPYGRILQKTGTNSQPFTFAGQWGMRQENTTLYHARARYYDATTGRFLSKEPLWPQITDPRLLNPYQYARNNPVMLVDPTGNEPVSPLPITPVYVEHGLAPDVTTFNLRKSIETAIVKKSYNPTDKGTEFRVRSDEQKKAIDIERLRNQRIDFANGKSKRKTVKKFAKPLFVNVQDEGDKIVVLIIDRSGTIPMVVDMFEIGKDELEAGKPKADKGVGSGVTRIEGENIVESAFRDKVADAVKIAVDSR